ncbi:MAG: hypothetical protein QF733_10075 [Phycisphaerales bacterium]|jgi:thiol-disulfide isomerase/thioredoxin|nr:hypothetical protein [Phycisphaerales bacterium]
MTYSKIAFAASAALVTTATATAAQRVVIAEEFTATWCTYCPSVAEALYNLQDDRPAEIIGMMIHCSDNYSTTWGDIRQNFYNVGGYPTVQLDGWNQKVGSSGSVPANYSDLNNRLNSCLSRPTDVSITMLGEELSASQYRVSCSLNVDAGGSSTPMRVQLLQCYDDPAYPEANELQFNTIRKAMTSFDVTIQPGDSHEFDHVFTLTGESLSSPEYVTYLCIAQEQASSGPADVFNAAIHGHGELPPEDVTVGPGGDYTSIQTAIDSVGSGSTITVMAGTYVGPLDFNGRSVHLISEDGAEATIIDADAAGTAITLMGHEAASMDGFTIRNGYAALGSAMRINGNPLISNCIIRDNVATSNYCILSSGNPVISGTLFCSNTPNNIAVSWVDGGGNDFQDTCPGDEPCDGDLNGDGVIGVDDILEAVSGFGTDYTVDDILLVLKNFGNAC